MLPLDVDGYAVANIIPRSDTIANLLALAGGVGEISEATDWDALVLHNGVAGGAKVLYCKPKICFLKRSTGSYSLANAVVTALPFGDAFVDPYSMWSSATPSRITLPAGANRLSITAGVIFGINASSNVGHRSIHFRINGGVATIFGLASSLVNSLTEKTPLTLVSYNARTSLSSPYVETYVYQNSGALLDIVTSITPEAVYSTFMEVRTWIE